MVPMSYPNTPRVPIDPDDFYDGDVVECAECGHLHFNRRTGKYPPCPLASGGCDCEGQK